MYSTIFINETNILFFIEVTNMSVLNEILIGLGKKYKNMIEPNARTYLRVNLGDEARSMGYDISGFDKVYAVIPTKEQVSGMKMIDGKKFVGYSQFNSGIVVPGYVAKDTNLPYWEYNV